MTAVANHLNKNNTAAYSSGVSTDNSSIHLDYLGGNSIDILKQSAETLQNESVVPFAEILSDYITPELAQAQYSNVLSFMNEYSHSVIGLGPYVITNVDAFAPALILSYYADFPFAADDIAHRMGIIDD